MSNEPGALYVVATPIGNLGDLSARAADVLERVDLIAAEDTRQTRKLLDHIGVRTRMVSLHEHNEGERTAGLLERLQAGAAIALVSDAGTPLISDPGFRLVRAARAAGLNVFAIPGACAAIAALSVAGLPSDRFVFEGFLPPRAAARRRRLGELAGETRTVIFYVAPRLLADTLADAAAAIGGEREAVVVREISKVFESAYSDRLDALAARSERDANMSRGEIVLLVSGAEAPAGEDQHADTVLGALLAADIAVRKAVDIAIRITGGSRNSLYDRALQLKRQIDAQD